MAPLMVICLPSLISGRKIHNIHNVGVWTDGKTRIVV